MIADVRRRKFANILMYVAFAAILLISDFRNVVYDSEPDYLANGLLILQSGIPWSAHHPGTITYYIVAGFAAIADLLEFSLADTVSLIRVGFTILAGFIIAACGRLTSGLLLCTFFLVLLAEGFYMTMNVLSAELLLLPLSLLFFCKLRLDEDRIDAKFLGVLFGVMVNVKFSAILLIPYVLLASCSTSGKKMGKQLATTLVWTSATFFILAIPVGAGFTAAIMRSLKQAVDFIRLMGDVVLRLQLTDFFIGISVLLVGCAAVYFFYSNVLKMLMSKGRRKHIVASDVFTGLMLLSALCVGLVDSFSLRHFVPFTPFFSYLILSIFGSPSFSPRLSFLAATIWIISWFALRAPSFENANQFDQLVLQQTDKVFLYQSAAFESEVRFLRWMNYRYGYSSLEFPKGWDSEFIDSSKDRVRLFNTRWPDALKGRAPEGAGKFDNYATAYAAVLSEQISLLKEGSASLLLTPEDHRLLSHDLQSFERNGAAKYVLSAEGTGSREPAGIYTLSEN